jgi:putative oxidoreductase
MAAVIGRFAPQTFALLRIVAGVMFTLHGSQKVLGWPPMKGMGGGSLPAIAVVAGWLELVLGTMIVIGLFTGIAAFIASGEMAVAYFTGHAPHGWIPIVNQGELAVLYCFLWLFVAAHGVGIWSVDGALRKRSTITASTGATQP